MWMHYQSNERDVSISGFRYSLAYMDTLGIFRVQGPRCVTTAKVKYNASFCWFVGREKKESDLGSKLMVAHVWLPDSRILRLETYYARYYGHGIGAQYKISPSADVKWSHLHNEHLIPAVASNKPFLLINTILYPQFREYAAQRGSSFSFVSPLHSFSMEDHNSRGRKLR